MSSTAGVTVGFDGSRGAEIALAWAADYARLHHCPLRLVSAPVVPLPIPTYTSIPLRDVGADAERDAQRLIERACKRLASPDLKMSGTVASEPPIPALLAASGDSALLVVGSRGLNPVENVLLGSVSTAVSAHARCPVVVVRSAARPGPRAPVVVGIDSSDRDPATLAAAFDTAARWHAPLTVLHSWSDRALEAAFGRTSTDWLTWEELRMGAAGLVADELADWKAKYAEVAVDTRLVHDEPARALLGLGASAGLIVVGSRGRGGFAGMALGSVARRLVHHADCPVFVVRGDSTSPAIWNMAGLWARQEGPK